MIVFLEYYVFVVVFLRKTDICNQSTNDLMIQVKAEEMTSHDILPYQ
jgi:hypothetical protein